MIWLPRSSRPTSAVACYSSHMGEDPLHVRHNTILVITSKLKQGTVTSETETYSPAICHMRVCGTYSLGTRGPQLASCRVHLLKPFEQMSTAFGPYVSTEKYSVTYIFEDPVKHRYGDTAVLMNLALHTHIYHRSILSSLSFNYIT